VRKASILILVLPLLAAAPEAVGQGRSPAKGGWPFGKDPGAVWGRGQDLYNLGIIGAKAKDPDDERAAPKPTPGVPQRFTGQGVEPKPNGPERLEIVLLYPDGPADRAGLEVGDVVVGVGRRPFRDGCFEPLARALLRAESGSDDGEITLRVEREGGKGTRKIEVKIPVAGRDARDPTEEEGRAAILKASLEWLAERQEESGGYPQTMSGLNGAVVMTSLAGLAWLSGGSDLKEGPHRENVAKAAEFVTDKVGNSMSFGGGFSDPRMGNTDQTNWGVAHAAIFLGELCSRTPTPRLKMALERCGKMLVERQEESGGYAHGPGGPNGLGYVELNIVTGLALCGMGLARHSGWEPPEETIEKAEEYLRASSGGDGGVGYSTKAGQKGIGNIGRTAAAWLGYGTLGRERSEWGRKMERWCRRNAGAVTDGHASLMQHVLLAGVAAHALGGDARERFWEALERDLVLARAPDGSLQPRPWHESRVMSSNSDVGFGEVWTTAAWAIVLGCEPERDGRPGLPAWMGRREPEGK